MLKENSTLQIQEFGGLWTTSAQMEEFLQPLTDNQKIRKALEAQLRFRRVVLGSRDTRLQLTIGGVRRTNEELISNVKAILEDVAIEREEVEAGVVDDEDFTMALVPQEKVEEQKKICLAKIRGNVSEERSGKAKPKRRRSTVNSDVPKIQHAEDLVGKRIKHLFHTDEGMQWYRGLVLGVEMVKKRMRTSYVFNVEYDGEEGMIQKYPLLTDLKKKEVEVIGLTTKDLIGHRIEQRFFIEELGVYEWWGGNVINVDDADSTDPNFLVEFDDEEQEGYSGHWFRLFDDYRKGDLKIVHK